MYFKQNGMSATKIISVHLRAFVGAVPLLCTFELCTDCGSYMAYTKGVREQCWG